jgi:hypothetical protein
MTQTSAMTANDRTAADAGAGRSLLSDTFGLSPDEMTQTEKLQAISGYEMRYSIEAMVAGISGKKIKHEYRGDGAATAPGLMILPRISATSLFPRRHACILLGYTAHEIAHQLKTDFRLLTGLLDDATIEPRRKQQLKEFWNAIEDYRIERLVRYEYPGFHVYIDDTRDFSAARFCDRVAAGLFTEKDLENPYRLGSVALTWVGADLNGYATAAPRRALDLLEPSNLAWVESWRADMAAINTCQDALDLAGRILDDLDRVRAGQDDSEEDGDKRPRPNVSDGDEQCNAEAADLEIEDLARVIGSMPGPEARDPRITDEKSLAGSRTGGADTQQEVVEAGREEYTRLRDEVGSSAARSAGILRRMLQSTAKRGWRSGRDVGELDFGLVVGMVRGSSNVYRERTVRSSVNTAVSLLLDNSGSMNGEPLVICQKTSIVLDMAIQGTGTTLEISGFTGNANRPVLYRYRAFGQNGRDASASLGNMRNVTLGGTPVSTPLLEAWRRLSKQKEPRRILIVVSDGGADGNDVENARAAHDFIVARGCIVIGIAVGAEQAMRRWCDNVQPIDSMEDLPIALTNLVREAMP